MSQHTQTLMHNVASLFLVRDDDASLRGLVCPRCLMFFTLTDVSRSTQGGLCLYAWHDKVRGLKRHLEQCSCRPASDRRQGVLVQVGQSMVRKPRADLLRLSYIPRLGVDSEPAFIRNVYVTVGRFAVREIAGRGFECQLCGATGRTSTEIATQHAVAGGLGPGLPFTLSGSGNACWAAWLRRGTPLLGFTPTAVAPPLPTKTVSPPAVSSRLTRYRLPAARKEGGDGTPSAPPADPQMVMDDDDDEDHDPDDDEDDDDEDGAYGARMDPAPVSRPRPFSPQATATVAPATYASRVGAGTGTAVWSAASVAPAPGPAHVAISIPAQSGAQPRQYPSIYPVIQNDDDDDDDDDDEDEEDQRGVAESKASYQPTYYQQQQQQQQQQPPPQQQQQQQQQQVTYSQPQPAGPCHCQHMGQMGRVVKALVQKTRELQDLPRLAAAVIDPTVDPLSMKEVRPVIELLPSALDHTEAEPRPGELIHYDDRGFRRTTAEEDDPFVFVVASDPIDDHSRAPSLRLQDRQYLVPVVLVGEVTVKVVARGDITRGQWLRSSKLNPGLAVMAEDPLDPRVFGRVLAAPPPTRSWSHTVNVKCIVGMGLPGRSAKHARAVRDALLAPGQDSLAQVIRSTDRIPHFGKERDDYDEQKRLEKKWYYGCCCVRKPKVDWWKAMDTFPHKQHRDAPLYPKMNWWAPWLPQLNPYVTHCRLVLWLLLTLLITIGLAVVVNVIIGSGLHDHDDELRKLEMEALKAELAIVTERLAALESPP